MKYKVINELDYFQYHDAVIISQEREHGCIAWTLSNLNVTTKVTLRDFEEDMCIKEARILFEQMEVEEISLYEDIGTFIEHGQQVRRFELHKKPLKTAEKILQDTDDSSYTWISCMFDNIDLGDGSYRVSFEIENDQEFFVITFRYKRATIEWDEYQGIAWYMEEEFKRYREAKKSNPEC